MFLPVSWMLTEGGACPNSGEPKDSVAVRDYYSQPCKYPFISLWADTLSLPTIKTFSRHFYIYQRVISDTKSSNSVGCFLNAYTTPSDTWLYFSLRNLSTRELNWCRSLLGVLAHTENHILHISLWNIPIQNSHVDQWGLTFDFWWTTKLSSRPFTDQLICKQQKKGKYKCSAWAKSAIKPFAHKYCCRKAMASGKQRKEEVSNAAYAPFVYIQHSQINTNHQLRTLQCKKVTNKP